MRGIWIDPRLDLSSRSSPLAKRREATDASGSRLTSLYEGLRFAAWAALWGLVVWLGCSFVDDYRFHDLAYLYVLIGTTAAFMLGKNLREG